MTKFQGFKIEHEEDSGFYWQEGGYFDTIEECKEDIAHWNAEETRRDHETFGAPLDTPSLEPPWWENR